LFIICHLKRKSWTHCFAPIKKSDSDCIFSWVERNFMQCRKWKTLLNDQSALKETIWWTIRTYWINNFFEYKSLWWSKLLHRLKIILNKIYIKHYQWTRNKNVKIWYFYSDFSRFEFFSRYSNFKNHELKRFLSWLRI
jgi:hypothetical protein